MNKSLVSLDSLRDLWDRGSLFDRFFAGALSPSKDLRGLSDKAFWSPAVDIIDKKDKIIVKAEIPGGEKKDSSLKVEDDTLSVCGESRQEDEVKKEDYYYSERVYGSFSRSIKLPSSVDREKVSAKFKKGVLTVELPKRAEKEKSEAAIRIE